MTTIKRFFVKAFFALLLPMMIIVYPIALLWWGREFVSGAFDFVFRKLTE